MNKSLLILLISLTSLLSYGGGWVQPKNNGFFKLGETVIRSKKIFDEGGSSIDIFTTSLYMTSIYGEYGLTDKINLIGYMPLFSRVTLNEVQFTSGIVQAGDAVNDIGDMEIGVKYGLIQNKPFVLSVALFFGVPSGTTQGGTSKILQTGDGEFNQLLKIEAGYGFQKIPMYTTFGVGINNRTKGFSEEFRYHVEIGYTFFKKLLLIAKANGIESLKNGEPTGSSNGIFSNNMESFVVGPEIVYSVKDNWGITANALAPLYGERILNSPSFDLGIFWKLK